MIDESIIPSPESVKSVVIDSNLLLLFLTGLYDPKQLPKNRVVRKYSFEDFEKLNNVIKYYNKTITLTPNIITEICNLSDKLNEESNHNFFRFIESFLSNNVEHIEATQSIIQKNSTCFYKFGVADASVCNLATKKNLVITDDLKLYHYLVSQGSDVINYNHLRLL